MTKAHDPGPVWVWWSTGLTRRASMSPVHLAESLEADKTLCGVAMTIGRSKYHRAQRYPHGNPQVDVGCNRCLHLMLGPGQRRAKRLAEGNRHLGEAVEALEKAMAIFKRLGRHGENHHDFAQRAWSALVTTSPEDFADEQARRERDE